MGGKNLDDLVTATEGGTPVEEFTIGIDLVVKEREGECKVQALGALADTETEARGSPGRVGDIIHLLNQRFRILWSLAEERRITNSQVGRLLWIETEVYRPTLGAGNNGLHAVKVVAPKLTGKIKADREGLGKHMREGSAPGAGILVYKGDSYRLKAPAYLLEVKTDLGIAK
ncbi:hypothetical protein ES703_53963 [subsurface metagenome]